jgi:hypothetical protein
MEGGHERFHYELALLLHCTKAEMLHRIPASELPYWAALFEIHAQEERDALDEARRQAS